MKKEKWIRYLTLGLGGLIFLFIGFVVAIYLVIFIEVRSVCDKAIGENGKDCVDSLVLVLQDENKSFKQRNDAIWVLGQIADKRALPELEKLYSGNIPEREPLDKTISQYELKKAIHWINDGNWTSWMYVRY